MADGRAFRRDRLLAAVILLVVLVTPIGSNNGTMPALNNLFLAAPFAIRTLSVLFSRNRKRHFAFPAAALTAAVFLMAAAQGIGFRACFSFGDGIYGEKRDAKVEKQCYTDRYEDQGGKRRGPVRACGLCEEQFSGRKESHYLRQRAGASFHPGHAAGNLPLLAGSGTPIRRRRCRRSWTAWQLPGRSFPW